MATLDRTWALAFVIAIMGAIGAVQADPVVAGAPSVASELSTPAAATACVGVSANEARQIAQQAHQKRAHRQAAECFRVAGDHVRADRAMVRASADKGADTLRKATANAETAKMQARRLREAFR